MAARPGQPSEIRIVDAHVEPSLSLVRSLIVEYQVSLGLDLEFQGFSRELAELPGDYVPPRGALLLATLDDRAVGCAALRPLDASRCEMKRLYVRPDGRGHGLGRIMAEQLIARARAAGYASILLDTLPSMQAAQAMYAALGFVDVPAYRDNPVPGSRFLALDLT